MIRLTVTLEDGESYEIQLEEKQAWINGQHLSRGALFYRLDTAARIMIASLTGGEEN